VQSAGRPYPHPAEPDLDTPEEQASALLHDLRESFAPSYLTLLSIIEGVFLGLTIELIATGHIVLDVSDPGILRVGNNVLLIALVWNEYRMGSSMFRWIPSLPDAMIPFLLGGLQAALLLTVARPMGWLAWLAAFYAAALVAYGNMYYRAGQEERNAFVMWHNRHFQAWNLNACVISAGVVGLLVAYHALRGTQPGWHSMGLVTLVTLAFLLRGELNWRVIVRATRTAVEGTSQARQTLSPGVTPPATRNQRR
jgi:lipoprotein signal peptidase